MSSLRKFAHALTSVRRTCARSFKRFLRNTFFVTTTSCSRQCALRISHADDNRNDTTCDAMDIIRSGKIRIGCIIARVREKVTVPRCFRYLALGHLSHNCISGNNTTKPCFQCGATDHLVANWKNEPKCPHCKAIGADHRHRSGSANLTALVKAQKRRLRKGNGKVYTKKFTWGSSCTRLALPIG